MDRKRSKNIKQQLFTSSLRFLTEVNINIKKGE